LPIFWPKSHKGPKNCPWLEKIGDRSGRKEVKKYLQSGNSDSKYTDAAGAPIAVISSQAKITTAKIENLKFTNESKFFKKNKYAPCQVAMCG
jgi:hypothetical protein